MAKNREKRVSKRQSSETKRSIAKNWKTSIILFLIFLIILVLAVSYINYKKNLDLSENAGSDDIRPLTSVTDCMVFDGPGYFTLTNNVTSMGTCFQVNFCYHCGDDNPLTVDCNGYTVTYATTQQGNGFRFSTIEGEQYVTIKNCNIVQGSTISNSDAFYSVGNIAGELTHTLISNNNITVNGQDSKAINLADWSAHCFNTVTLNNIIVNHNNNDLNFSRGLIELNVVENEYQTSGPCASGTYNEISYNTITVRNASTNVIVLSGFKDTIKGNKIIYSNNNQNRGSGIKIKRNSIWPAYNNNLILNTIEMHNYAGKGVDIDYNGTTGSGQGLNLSFNNITTYNTSDAIYADILNFSIIDRNTLTVHGPDSRGISFFGNSNAISNNKILADTVFGSDGEGIRFAGQSNQIVFNNITTYSNNGDGISDYGWTGNSIIGNNISFNDILTTNTLSCAMYFANSNDVSNNLFMNNIVNVNGTDTCGFTIAKTGSNNQFIGVKANTYGPARYALRIGTPNSNNKAFDCVLNSQNYPDIYFQNYLSGTSSLNVTNCSFSDVGFGTDSILNVFWYLEAYVKDSNNNPISGASVTIKNVRNELIGTYSTLPDGTISRLTLREYRQNSTIKTFDTNYNISASKSGYNPNYALVNLTTNKIGANRIILILNNGSGDTTPPIVTIISPINTTYTTNSVWFNVSLNEQGSLCTYILDSFTNISMPGNGTLFYLYRTGLSETQHNIIFYCRDLSNNLGASPRLYFTINTSVPDTTPPTITIQSPGNTTYSVNSVWANVTINESGSCLRNLDNTGNVTMSNTTGNWNSLMTSLSNSLHNVRFYCRDSSYNWATSLRYFTVDVPDATPPTITIQSPGNTTYTTSSIWFNVSLDEQGNSCSYSIDSATNVSMSGSGTYFYNYQTNLTNGLHNVIFYCRDLRNNLGASPRLYFTVNVFVPDTEAPKYSNPVVSPSSPQTYDLRTYTFSADWTDNILVDDVILQFNNTNYSYKSSQLTKNGNTYSKQFSNLNAGTYPYRWYAKDNSSNWNSTSPYNYLINEANNILTLASSSGWSVNYPSSTTATCTATSGTPNLFRNNTQITNPSTLSLGANSYTIKCNISGNQNYYENSTLNILVINKNPGACSIMFNASSPLNYPNSFIVFSNCNSASNLYRNGTLISNNSITSGAGYWNFTLIRTDNQNYTSTYNQEFFTINKANFSLGITANPAWQIMNGTATNITGTNCPSGLTCLLYRNSQQVQNPDNQINLPVGSYVYVYNTSGNQNYSSAFKTNTLIISATPVDALPQVIWQNPLNNYETTDTTITFMCNATDDKKLSNLSLYTNVSGWSRKQIQGCSEKTCNIINTTTLSVGIYQWNCVAYDNASQYAWGINYTLKIIPQQYQQYCSDGTLYGQCSNNKPKYCDSGNLIDKCSTCGCSSGYSCQSDETCKSTTSGGGGGGGSGGTIICTSGQKRCNTTNAKILEQCANNQWNLLETCTYSCNSTLSICNPMPENQANKTNATTICVENENKCSGDGKNVLTCLNNVWKIQSCEFGCENSLNQCKTEEEIPEQTQLWIYLVVGVAALSLIVLIILFLTRKKNEILEDHFR